MNVSPRTPSGSSSHPPSFPSNVPPPSYQLEDYSQHPSAPGRSLGTLSPDTVSDISLGSGATHPGPRYVEVCSPVNCWCCDNDPLLSLSVYYRVYSPTSGVEVQNPEFPEDPYLGRTIAIRIPPPHLAANIKHHICGREGIADYEHTSLFPDISCLTPLNDSEPVDILDHAGSGTTYENPIVLVTRKWEAPKHTHVPDSAGNWYQLKAHHDRKVNSRTSEQIPNVFCSVHPANSGWLSFKKGDILHTDGVPIKGEAPLQIRGPRSSTLIPLPFRPKPELR